MSANAFKHKLISLKPALIIQSMHHYVGAEHKS